MKSSAVRSMLWHTVEFSSASYPLRNSSGVLIVQSAFLPFSLDASMSTASASASLTRSSSAAGDDSPFRGFVTATRVSRLLRIGSSAASCSPVSSCSCAPKQRFRKAALQPWRRMALGDWIWDTSACRKPRPGSSTMSRPFCMRVTLVMMCATYAYGSCGPSTGSKKRPSKMPMWKPSKSPRPICSSEQLPASVVVTLVSSMVSSSGEAALPSFM
mmetsp:Transcript_18631/g.56273  ORF Transcript_18631/g.56273 Transcript_18631/m.56273 type:complete len:215 (+) Transcript_18631:278-922(+)